MTIKKPTILIVGTLDTKYPEVLFLRDRILAASNQSCQTRILDVSRNPGQSKDYPDLPASEVISPLHDLAQDLQTKSRGEFVDIAISTCLPVVQELVTASDVHGIVSAAGSTGSSLATALMRKACPVGFPKLMVSTVASGDIGPYIGESDITMMYSVVDIAGINSILMQILSNAAGAIVGMTSAYLLQTQAGREARGSGGKRIAVTMFGVTTPCVDMIRNILSTTPHDVSKYEIYVFHATGAGGRTMERLIEEGQIDAVIDLTTTEIADEIAGGVMTAGARRLEAAMKKGIPTIVSVGACDMVNFGAKATVPQQYADRKLHVHNPTVTLMRTTLEENRQIGQLITAKLKTAVNPAVVRVVFPRAGLSMLDIEGQDFHDPEADTSLFEAIESGLGESKIETVSHLGHINTEEFAKEICEQLLDVMGVDPRSYRLANARRRQWSFDHGGSIAKVRRASLVNVPSVED